MISLSSFASSLPTPSIRVPSLPSLPTIPPLSLPTFSLPAALQRPAPPPSTQLLTTLTRYLLLYPSLLLLALIFALSFSSYLLSALHDYDTHVEKSRLKPQHFDLENTVKPPVVKEGVVERNPRTPPPAPPSVAMKMVVGELVGKQRREQEEKERRRRGVWAGAGAGAGCSEKAGLNGLNGLNVGVVPVGRGVWVE